MLCDHDISLQGNPFTATTLTNVHALIDAKSLE